MNLSITGYSTALFSTWYFIDELGILFDAGDGVSSGLLQKARKISHVFISHADRDHLNGLFQFNQLNARPGLPVVHFPKDCGSFPRIAEFTQRFDPHVSGTVWKPVVENESIQIRDDMFVETIRNGHVQAAEGISKSLSYKVIQTKYKMKPEFAGLPQNQIRDLMAGPERQNMLTEVRTNLLSFSGDTPVEDFARWDNSEVLIHEATFLGGVEDKAISLHGQKHSSLEEVIKMVSEIKVGKLILGHFSSRYSKAQIDENIRTLCKAYKITIPVFRVLPGEIHRDILAGDPIN